MNIGEKIQIIRKENKLSQEEFAEKLGVSRQAISKWELGDSIPDIAKIALISKTFDISTDSIIFDTVDLKGNTKNYGDLSNGNGNSNADANRNANGNDGTGPSYTNTNAYANANLNGTGNDNANQGDNGNAKPADVTKFQKAAVYTGKTAKKYVYIIGYVLVVFGTINLVLSAILGIMWIGFSNELSNFLTQYDISLNLQFVFWIFIFMAIVAVITLGIGILIAVKGKKAKNLAGGSND
jgi:transcriptional regulator with XRE-family HTH domain